MIKEKSKIFTYSISMVLASFFVGCGGGGGSTYNVSGHDFTKVPHGWIAGTQTVLLKQQIDTMVDGNEFVMSIPKSPYRCPPGPYERACVVAHYLKNVKGYSNSKVTVLDANSDIIVEKATFGGAFTSYGVDYIPNQKAASLIFDAGLNSGNWASVDAISYESTITSGIYIIGDSQGTSQPKAGHIGNAEAKVCADAILRKINNVALYANPKINSACYSPISTTEASWLTVVYEYDSTTKDMKPVSGAGYPTAGAASTTNYNKMFGWSTNLFKDTFY